MTVRATTPDAVRAALAAFRALHGDREGRGPLLAEQDRLDAAIVAGVERGEARVDVFGSDDVVAAVSVAFTVAGRLCLYQLARSLDDAHDGAGTALLAAVVENAAEKGCREVDLLRGDEGYKRSFADEQRTLGRLRAAGGLRGRLLLAAEDAARRVKAAVSARRTSRRAGSAA
jgi:CelD/BcsL family acetyltransferase involved in cellulose biosynthesis